MDLSQDRPETYNAFNLLVADAEGAWIASNKEGAIAVEQLGPGVHLVTNLDLNDPTCPRIAASHQLFATLLGSASHEVGGLDFRRRLRSILSRHDTQLDPRGTPFGNSLCLHSEEYGTRSSTLIFLDETRRWTYFHSDAPPCRSDYQPLPAMDLLSPHPERP